LFEFGVDLGDGGGVVAEDDPGFLDVELVARLGCGVVAELVRIQAVGFRQGTPGLIAFIFANFIDEGMQGQDDTQDGCDAVPQ